MKATKPTIFKPISPPKTNVLTQDKELQYLREYMWETFDYIKPNPHAVLTLFSEIVLSVCMSEGMSKANAMQAMDRMWDIGEAFRSAPDLWEEKLKECKK